METAHFQGPARASVSLPRTCVCARLIVVRTCVFSHCAELLKAKDDSLENMKEARYEYGDAECLLCDEWWGQDDMTTHHGHHGDGWVCMDCHVPNSDSDSD